MKKIFSFIGVLFLGSAAMGQTAKPDTAKKTDTRKVLTGDVKNTPPAEHKASVSDGIAIKFKGSPIKANGASESNTTPLKDRGLKSAVKDSAAKQTPRKG